MPLFVSHTTIKPRKTLPRASTSWALDSGGFTELDRHGGWQTTEDAYVAAVTRYADEIGRLEWAAPMDWMCEPHMLERTGLTVREHQERTVANYVALRERGPFVPVLQGWTRGDYELCVELYDRAGVDLRGLPLVGLGTVCRRQDTPAIREIVTAMSAHGIRLHGFGVKSRGLRMVGHLLASADSLAWSSRARNAWQHDHLRLCGGEHRGGCANCRPWALQWRDRVVDGLGLFGAEVAA